MCSGKAVFIGQRMALLPFFAFGLTLLAPALYGDPISPCSADTVATYSAAGFQCIVDGYTLEDFTFSSSQTGGATLLTASQITVDPTTAATGVSVQFSGDFIAAADQTEEYIFQYELDPVLPRVLGTSIETGPGDPVILTGQFCGDGTLNAYVPDQPTSCSGTATSGIFPSTLHIIGNDMTTGADFPSAVTDLDSRLVLDLDGPASVTSFGSTANVANAVPEPSTVLFLTPGMLAILWLRKRFLVKGR